MRVRREEKRRVGRRRQGRNGRPVGKDKGKLEERRDILVWPCSNIFVLLIVRPLHCTT